MRMPRKNNYTSPDRTVFGEGAGWDKQTIDKLFDDLLKYEIIRKKYANVNAHDKAVQTQYLRIKTTDVGLQTEPEKSTTDTNEPSTGVRLQPVTIENEQKSKIMVHEDATYLAVYEPEMQGRTCTSSAISLDTEADERSRGDMEDTTVEGPGPNAYSLPPQVGYTGHDASKWRNPAFSMGLKSSAKGNDFGPGPAYKVDKMTRHGNAYSPSAPFGQRTGLSGKGVGPGPGAYNPDTKNIGKINHVGGTFGMRPDDVAKSIGPGPNAYNVKDPTLKRQPAFAMGTRNDMAQKHVGPGPNAYNPKRQDNVPTVKFGPPPGKTSAKDTGPGPGAYQGEQYLKYNKKANPPKFAFGVKTSNSPYITPEDNAVCELICRK